MKRIITIPATLFFLLFYSYTTTAQDLEVAGKVKIGTMDPVSSADSVVVVLPDGTLARMHVSALSGWILKMDTTTTDKYVGIGVTSPHSGLHVAADERVLFGADTTGLGRKLMWIGSKGALRAGNLEDVGFGGEANYWDLDSVGVSSTSLGESNRSTGYASTTFGFLNSASGPFSASFGEINTSSAHAATSWGSSNVASGQIATAWGAGNLAQSAQETVLGLYADTIAGANPDTWITTDQLFVIGNGTADNARNNALTVLKNGDVGMNTQPASDLHVKQTEVNDSISGIRIEHLDGDFWQTNIDTFNDYSFYYNGTFKAWIEDADGTFNTPSDKRLKSDISNLDDVLVDVMRLNPSNYYFKDNKVRRSKSYGFIAQEVQRIFPDFVTEKNGLLGIAYSNFIPILTKAIQEQQKMISSVNKLNEKLSTKNDALEKRIDRLERMVSTLSQKMEQ